MGHKNDPSKPYGGPLSLVKALFMTLQPLVPYFEILKQQILHEAQA